MCPESFGEVRFDLGSLIQGQMWYLMPMMDYISSIIGHRGFGCEVNLYEIMCPESFGGVRYDIILCMSRLNDVPSGDTLRRDAISSCNIVFVVLKVCTLIFVLKLKVIQLKGRRTETYRKNNNIKFSRNLKFATSTDLT